MRTYDWDEIIDWQACSKEYIKTTGFYWILVNRFTNYQPKKMALWAWTGWAIDSSPEFQECRAATMLEF